MTIMHKINQYKPVITIVSTIFLLLLSIFWPLTSFGALYTSDFYRLPETVTFLVDDLDEDYCLNSSADNDAIRIVWLDINETLTYVDEVVFPIVATTTLSLLVDSSLTGISEVSVRCYDTDLDNYDSGVAAQYFSSFYIEPADGGGWNNVVVPALFYTASTSTVSTIATSTVDKVIDIYYGGFILFLVGMFGIIFFFRNPSHLIR